MDPIAVQVVRGDTVESVHRASVAVCDPKGRLVASFGRPALASFLRSSAKPVQAIVLVESGAADAFGFTEQELAIACGSHSGEPGHVRVVEGMLAKIGLDGTNLQCGRHPPYNAQAAAELGANYTPLHSNCSGKHIGMLAVCVHKGWDPATYRSFDHPLQQEILRAMSQEAGLRPERIPRAVDGCGVPTFALPVRSCARVYARLARPDGLPRRRALTVARIRDAMLHHPFLVSGTGRLDADFMNARPGGLIMKAGAEAYYSAALVHEGWGVAMKIEDGNTRAVAPAMAAVLRQLGVADDGFLTRTKNHWDEPLRNIAGETVGRVEAVLELRRAAAKAATVVT